jgi:hypothetical protein
MFMVRPPDILSSMQMARDIATRTFYTGLDPFSGRQDVARTRHASGSAENQTCDRRQRANKNRSRIGVQLGSRKP